MGVAEVASEPNPAGNELEADETNVAEAAEEAEISHFSKRLTEIDNAFVQVQDSWDKMDALTEDVLPELLERARQPRLRTVLQSAAMYEEVLKIYLANLEGASEL